MYVIGIFFWIATQKMSDENSVLAIRNMLQILEGVPLQTPSNDNEDEISDSSG